MLRTMCLAACLLSTSALAAESADLASLVNQRLGYMKDVAGYKAAHHLAIEDLQQEDNVLKASRQQATQYGLDADSVTPFIRAQMDAAKAIQYRYRADWLAMPEQQDWQPRPLDDVRTQIAKLNGMLLQQLADTLHQQGGSLSRLNHAAFMHTVTQKNLSEHDKARLFTTLKQAKLQQ
ncbi:Secreted chorismate mutase [Dickeya dianthicola]|nr:chorismate mutase [Dickeya dianthicola]ATO31404.1 Periplasmic chorismate mutase I precursor [Dickeya dianthicola RNS04.9]AYC17385.1 Secreted chorismate mutase [Dickeya dianthicola]MBT1426581.1 chorismate mutase [Dickeya dianthicola]MBT1430635.1 chorismate mutase [Dickeya dianthicola]MBT1458104.1 chorismate mutase [Dickeya dianthicola]